jgi:hypothetical protein
MAIDARACPHCGSANVRVTLQTYSTTFLFCDACGCAWDVVGEPSPLAVRPMWAFAREDDRLSITVQSPVKLIVRSATINERQTFASPEDLEKFRSWFEQFLYRNGWALLAKGIDRRADADRRGTERPAERRVLRYKLRSD